MSRTANFDLTVQITEPAIQKVVRSQHAAGAVLHLVPWVQSPRKGDLVLNAPQVTLVPTPAATKRTNLDARVFYNARPTAEGYETVGDVAVVDVDCTADWSLTTGNPGLITSATRLSMDLSATTRADLAEHALSSAVATEAGDLVFAQLQASAPRSFKIPSLGSGSQAIGCLGFHFASSGGNRFLTVGMNVGTVLKGTPSNLTTKYVERDWAMAFSATYFLARVQAGMDAEFSLPHELSRRCTVSAPWPLSGCWNRSIVTLTSLHVSLGSGELRVSGSIHVHNTGALIPDDSASFVADVHLSISSSGSISATVGDVDVDFSLLGDVANFLSGNSFRDKIASAVRLAIAGNVGTGFSSFFSAAKLNNLARAGGASTQLELQATSVAVDTAGVVVHGDLIAALAAQEPRLSFFATPSGPRATAFVFNARESFAPGRRIQTYFWEHSDGATQEYSGIDAQFVTEHSYDLTNRSILSLIGIAPTASTCLRITDDTGNSEKFCIAVIPSRRIRIDWKPRDIRIEGLVTLPKPLPNPMPPWDPERPLIRTSREAAEIFGMPLMTGRRTWEIEGNFIRPPSAPPNVASVAADHRHLDLLLPDRPAKVVLPLSATWAGRAIAGAQVTARGEGWKASGATDKNGALVLRLDDSLLSRILAAKPQPLGVRYSLSVRCEQDDLEPDVATLWISTSAERADVYARMKRSIIALADRYRDCLDRHGIREPGDVLAADGSVRRRAVEISRTLNVLRECANLFEHGSAWERMAMILEISAADGDIPGQCGRRIDELFRAADAVLNDWKPRSTSKKGGKDG